MTFAAFQSLAAAVRERAARIDAMLYVRANGAARRAGLDVQRNVWTNAMIGQQTGRPWREVDYRSLRLALHLDGKRDALSSIVDAYLTRKFHTIAR